MRKHGLNKKQFVKIAVIIIMLLVIIQITLPSSNFISTISYATGTITLTFSENGITETVSGSGYKISQTTGTVTGNTLNTLTINESGIYRVNGSCTNGNIVIKKNVSGVTLILDNLTLDCSDTAPIVIKKSESETTSATIQLVGTSTITDSEDPDNEESINTTIADEFEGAAIKVKSGSELTIKGTGILNIDSSNCKNGIKGAATSSITINSGIINVNAAKNGISCDGNIIINGGTVNVISEGDGIKSEPDSDDTESDGTITINGGTININAQGDGIQATKKLYITNGDFNITTLDGYNSSNFDSDTMSCKGLKSSTNEQEDIESEIEITGGNFYLNTADDAIHSDYYVTITGGTFEIYTGDDGVHADTSLILGIDGGLERDPCITINSSYEGLEAGTVYIYSGKYYIISDDDGINAAGGSSNGSDPGNNGDSFKPGGNSQNQMGGNNNSNQSSSSSGSSEYAIYIYGGYIYINVEGDGIDSNGDIYIYGGTTEVWGMKSGGDNEPIDHDGSLIIQNATVFAGGTQGMECVHSGISSTNQSYIYSTNSYSVGKTIYVKNNSGSVEYHTTTPKNVNYLFYTSPNATSSYSFSTSSSATCSSGNAWNHTWDEGVVTTKPTENSNGIITYTCSTCGETERQTILYSASDYGIEIKLENKTNGIAMVDIGEESSTEDISTYISEGKFSVTCSSPCVVLITDDNGNTYSRISAVETEDENTYNFIFDLIDDLKVIVALKGDVNFNGSVNASDTMLINRSNLSSSLSAYRALSALEKEVADINGNGTVNAADAMLINRSNLSSSLSAYAALTW